MKKRSHLSLAKLPGSKKKDHVAAASKEPEQEQWNEWEWGTLGKGWGNEWWWQPAWAGWNESWGHWDQ